MYSVRWYKYSQYSVINCKEPARRLGIVHSVTLWFSDHIVIFLWPLICKLLYVALNTLIRNRSNFLISCSLEHTVSACISSVFQGAHPKPLRVPSRTACAIWSSLLVTTCDQVIETVPRCQFHETWSVRDCLGQTLSYHLDLTNLKHMFKV